MSDLPGVPEPNVMVEPGELHMEVIDLGTRRVWQSLHPVGRDEYEAMHFEPPLVKVGLGRAAMDAHGFRRSPEADEDGPMERRALHGRVFVFCAMPEGAGMASAAEPGGPQQLMVNKHHSLLYRAGRSLDFMRLPDGQELVHVIAAEEGAPPPKLPEGWQRESVALAQDLLVELPCPTTVYFFPNGDSYQGPARRP